MPTDIVEQLETQVVAMQFLLCSKQKQMQDYFKSTPRAPTPSKEPRAVTPIKDVSFKTVADATKDVSLVHSLDMDDLELESIDTTMASVAVSALMKETPTHFSTPNCPHPPTSEPQPSTSMVTESQPPPKKLRLGLSCPLPKTFKLYQVVDKVMNMSSGSSSVCTSIRFRLRIIKFTRIVCIDSINICTIKCIIFHTIVLTVLTCIQLNVLYFVHNVSTTST